MEKRKWFLLIEVLFFVAVILVGVAGAAPMAKLRSLVLQPGDGVLVKCNGGTISAQPDGQYQVFVWCNVVAPPTSTNTPVVPPTKTNTPTATNTPVPPATKTNTPTATNTPVVPPTKTNTPTATNTPAIPPATSTYTPTPDEPPTGKTYYLKPGESFSGIAGLLGPGDQVVLLAGVHTSSLLVTNVHGAPGSPIRITGQLNSDGTFATVIRGGYIRVRNSTDIEIMNLEAVASVSRHGIEADPNSPGVKLTQNIVFRHIFVHDLVGGDGNGTICLQVDNEPDTVGVFNVLVEDYRCENNAPVHSSRDTVGVYLGDWSAYPEPFAPIDNITLRNIYLFDIGTACVDMKPNLTNVLIDGLTCIDSGNPTQSENGIVVRGKKITIRNSYLKDIGTNYLSCSDCTGIKFADYGGRILEDVLVENNVIETGIGSYGIGGSSIYYDHGHNVISRQNVVTGFGGREYWGYSTAAEACARVGQECP